MDTQNLDRKLIMPDNWLSMKGTLRTLEKCVSCQGNFKPVQHPFTKDIIDLMCPSCMTRPRYFYIDARDFKAGKIYKDKKGKKFDSFLAVHRQLEEMRAQDDKHTFDPSDWMPKKLKEYRFKEAANDWIDKLKIDKSFSYVRHTRSYIDNHIIPVMGDMDIRDIRSSHVEGLYYGLVKKKLAAKTIDDIMSTLQTLLNRLYRLELISRMPIFPVVSVPEKHKGWINAEKQAQILSFIPERHRLIYELLIETAERPGEVCAQKKKDLIDGEMVIERAFDEKGHTKQTKSGRVRYCGISLVLWKKLLDYSKDKLPEAWLFLDEFGQPYSQGRLYAIWKRAGKKADINISLYGGTRRSRASQKRLEKEKEIAEACRQELGHTSGDVTMKHYARSRREQI